MRRKDVPAIPGIPRILSLALFVLLAGCFPAQAFSVPTGPPPPGWEDPRRHASSMFGIEYAFPHDHNQSLETAGYYRDLGARWVKFSRVQWAAIEPDPPKEGRHRYDWAKLDAYVAAWQRAGYNIQFQISATSDWAQKEMAGKGTDAFLVQLLFRSRSRGIRPEHLGDYGDFVTALVERYDADGKDDMPGLLAPILHHEIESEVQNIGFWTGSVEDYRELLKTAYPAVKRASGDAKVLLAGIQLADVVQDNPSEAVLQGRYTSILNRVPENVRVLGERVKDFVPALFTMQDSFDIVEFHSLEDYTVIAGTYGWIKGQMRRYGYDRPVWVGDASSAIEVGKIVGIPPENGLTEPQRAEIRRAIDGAFQPKHAATVRWYRAEQSKLAVKKMVVSAACGSERIFLAALEDWPGAFSPWPYHGLVEKKGVPRPVFQAYRMLAGKIDGFRSVRKIEAGSGVWAYLFDVGGRPVAVAWTDDGRARKAGEAEGAKEVTLPLAFSAPAATVTRIPTGEGEAAEGAAGTEVADVGEVATHAGAVTLQLTETPVIIEPASARQAR